MAETITIQVSVNDTKALASLNNLQALVDKLNRSVVNIPAGVGGGTGNGTGGSGSSGRSGTGGGGTATLSNLSAGYIHAKTAATDYGNTVKVVETYTNELNQKVEQTKEVLASTGQVLSTVEKTTTDYTAAQKAMNANMAQSSQLGYNMNRTLSKIGDLSHLYPSGTFDNVKAGINQLKADLDTLDQKFANNKSSPQYAEGLRQIGIRATELNRQFQELVPNQTRFARLLGDSLGNIVAKIAAWQVINAAVATVVRSIKNAVATMKEVDTQLTNIQKVSGASTAELNKLGDSAYETASKYGVAADEYLSAVYTFTKAGLSDNAAELAELATKTMLVGDTTADVASKFLIATNAAWQMNGSMAALSDVVDKADYINNNFATDLAKLSEGMPIVASTAANLGMSVEETMAVLGTITSITQETGTKAATAWRALVMNITGELGEIADDSGETIEVTEESVKSLAGVLEEYAHDAVQAARDAGELINPMKAVTALAEAYKDKRLNDQELFNIMSDVGGKLRANQLTALVKDLASETSIYRQMMEGMGEAAGTADAEISVMLDSWTSKTQILQNTWTQFISHLADTGAVKGALDVITGLIKVLDNDLVKSVATIAMLTAGFSLLAKAVIAVAKSTFVAWLGLATSSVSGLSNAVAILNAKLLANPVIAIAAAAAVAIYGVVKAVDALTVSYEEQKAIVEEAAAAVADHQSELDGLIAKEGELTAAQKARREELEKILQLEKDTLAFEQGQLYIKYQKENTSNSNYRYANQMLYRKYKSQIVDLIKQYGAGKISEDKYKEGLLEVRSAMSETAKTLQEFKDSNVELLEIDEDFLDMFDNIVNLYSGFQDATNDASAATETFQQIVDSQTDSFKAAADAVKGYEAALEGLKDFDANFDQMKSAFESAKEAFEEGEISSPEMIAFLQTAFSPEQFAGYGYSVSKAWEAFNQKGLASIFESKDPELAFFNYVKSKSKSDTNVSDLVTFDSKGALKAIESYEKLADVLGVSEGLVTTFFEALNGRWDTFVMEGEKATEVVDGLNKTFGESYSDSLKTEAFWNDADKVKEFAEAVRQLTGSAHGTELANQIEGLLNALGIEITDTTRKAFIDGVEAVAKDPPPIQVKAKVEPTVETDTEDTAESIFEESKKLDEVNANVETLSQEVQTATTEITEALNGLKAAIGSYDGENLGTIIQSVSDVLTTAKDNSDVILQKLAIDALNDEDTTQTVIKGLLGVLNNIDVSADDLYAALNAAATGNVTQLSGIISSIFTYLSNTKDGGAKILAKLGEDLTGSENTVWQEIGNALTSLSTLTANAAAAEKLIGLAETKQTADQTLVDLIKQNRNNINNIGLSADDAEALIGAADSGEVETIIDIINANKDNINGVGDAADFATDLIGAVGTSETAGASLVTYIKDIAGILEVLGLSAETVDKLVGEAAGGDSASLAALIVTNAGLLQSTQKRIDIVSALIGVLTGKTGTDTLASAITADKTAAQGVLDAIQGVLNQVGVSTVGGSIGSWLDTVKSTLAAGAEKIKSAIDTVVSSLSSDAKGKSSEEVWETDASGTDYARGGATLVNDGKPVNGSPAELIVDSHGAYIANSGNPAMVNLERGAKVYTAEETAEILRGDKRKYVQAFAGGSAIPTGKTNTNTSSKTSGSSGGSSARASSSSSSGEKTVGEQLAEKVNDLLSNLEKQITLAENRNDTVLAQALREEAIELVKTYVNKMLGYGLKMNDNEVLDLINKGYGYSSELMNELVDALEELTNATDKASALEEKRQAVEDAQKSLENIRNQRNVRILNPVTGQWEWVANADDITAAEKELEEAQKALQEEQVSQELEALKKAGIGDIENLTLGEGILSLINSASTEEQQKIADVLNAITGGAENSVDKNGTSLFKSTDSHDTVYQFGNITLTDEQANSMTVKQLAGMIRELEVT